MVINTFLVKADNFCDYIPCFSTVSNLIDLFQKCVIVHLINKQTVINSRYFTHLKQKSFLRCTVLLIPVIGNVLIGIYDFKNRKQEDKSWLTPNREEKTALNDASEKLQLSNPTPIELPHSKKTNFKNGYCHLQSISSKPLTTVSDTKPLDPVKKIGNLAPAIHCITLFLSGRDLHNWSQTNRPTNELIRSGKFLEKEKESRFAWDTALALIPNHPLNCPNEDTFGRYYVGHLCEGSNFYNENQQIERFKKLKEEIVKIKPYHVKNLACGAHTGDGMQPGIVTLLFASIRYLNHKERRREIVKLLLEKGALTKGDTGAFNGYKLVSILEEATKIQDDELVQMIQNHPV